MNFTVEQLQENFDKLIGLIDTHISSPRKEKLIEMYTDHQERLMLMPASGTIHYHNCFPGGYVDHVIRVVECALKLKDVWNTTGAAIDFTDEELVFAAINHDLGKIGTEAAEQYIDNPSDWHKKNQGKIYVNNPANAFMTVPDRGLKLLADRGIGVSDNEWFGIKLHDGMYEEANKPYYVNFNPDSALRTNLPYLLHHADMLAARIEKTLSTNATPTLTAPKTSVKPTKRSASLPVDMTEDQKEELKKAFGNLFE
jgi:hypothetical protein